MDSGCSSWLVKDGVPEKELHSVKLRDGPIPMWVAGGHTVSATAEWSSLLPLADGSHQIVRGLSTKHVTGNLGDVDMEPIIEEIREAARKSEALPGSDAALKIQSPKVISGDIDMLIGSKYLSIYPEPVFSTTEGLTIYRSKFLTYNSEETACVGGPSKAFADMVQQMGHTDAINMLSRILENLRFCPNPIQAGDHKEVLPPDRDKLKKY